MGPLLPSLWKALVRYVFMILKLTRKSDSLKSYATFHPMRPYFRLSCTTAWKKASTYTNGRNRLCGHDARSSSSTLEYDCRMLSFSPFGGSVTTLRDIWRMLSGKFSVGSVVIHSRKSLFGSI